MDLAVGESRGLASQTSGDLHSQLPSPRPTPTPTTPYQPLLIHLEFLRGRGKKEMDLLGQHKLSHAQLTPKVCNPAELS